MAIKINNSYIRLINSSDNADDIVEIVKDSLRREMYKLHNDNKYSECEFLFKRLMKDVTFTFEARLNRLQSLIIVENLDSYSIQSQRYCKYDENAEVILDDFENMNESLQRRIEDYLNYSLDKYDDLCNAGVKAEDARYILPLAFPCYNVITVKGDKLVDLLKVMNYYKPLFNNALTELINSFKESFDKKFKSVWNTISSKTLIEDIIYFCNNMEEMENLNFHNITDKAFNKEFNKYSLSKGDIENICKVYCSRLDIAGIAALTCTNEKSVDELKEEYDSDSLKKVAKNVITKLGHTSVGEHVNSVTYATFSLPCYNQLVRHRHHNIARLSFQSMLSSAILDNHNEVYVTPQSFKLLANNRIYYTLQNKLKNIVISELLCNNDNNEVKLILAQLIPFGKREKFIINSNLINDIYVCSKRTCNTAQWEIRDFTYKKLSQIANQINPALLLGARPECLKTKCKEGKKCCGKQNDIKKLFEDMGIVE